MPEPDFGPPIASSSLRCVSMRCVQAPTRMYEAWPEWNTGPGVQLRTCAKIEHIGTVINTMIRSGYKTITVTLTDA